MVKKFKHRSTGVHNEQCSAQIEVSAETIAKMEEKETLLVLDVCMPVSKLFFTIYPRVIRSYTFFSVDFTQLRMNVHLCSVFCTHKNESESMI